MGTMPFMSISELTMNLRVRFCYCQPKSPPQTTSTVHQKACEENDIPLLLGSEVLNLLWILLDNLGAPVFRFIENFLSMNDIFAVYLPRLAW